MVDYNLDSYSFPRTRRSGDMIEVQYFVKVNGYGKEIQSIWSTSTETGMRNLINRIMRYLSIETPWDEDVRLYHLYDSFVKNAISRRNDKDREYWQKRMKELEPSVKLADDFIDNELSKITE